MRTICVYLIGWLLLLFLLSIIHQLLIMPAWYINNLLLAESAYMGGLGGVLYCLRAIYINRCVLKRWDNEWNVWYYLRPFTSCISGLVSCIFMKAGILLLDASIPKESIPYGYLAIAFIAGYNVDNFLKKIESIADSMWGISKSRISEEGKDTKSSG